jgi:hypothetical protein
MAQADTETSNQKSLSPKSKQRAKVASSFRGRGRANSNLWLVYSHKTTSDCVLVSDRELVHWIFNMEVAFNVFSYEQFEFGKMQNPKNISKRRAFLVQLRDGSQELHCVVGGIQDRDRIENDVSADWHRMGRELIKIKVFTDEDLAPLVEISMRWLKVFGFVSALRGLKFNSALQLLTNTIEQRQQGNVSELVHDCGAFDAATVCGVIGRLAIDGRIDLCLNRMSFCGLTPWKLRKVKNVVA